MIDCGESDGMIEICGKLDKSNTFDLDFVLFNPKNFFKLKLFSEFFFS